MTDTINETANQVAEIDDDLKRPQTARDNGASRDSCWKVKPGFFSVGIPDLKYEPKEAQDLRFHLCRIKEYHDKLAIQLRKTERDRNGAEYLKVAKEMYRCTVAQVKLVMDEWKSATNVWSALDSAGAPRSSISAAQKNVQKWDRKLTKACDKLDETKKLMAVRQLGGER